MRLPDVSLIILSVALAAGCSSSKERPEAKRERDRAAMTLQSTEKARDEATEKAKGLEASLAGARADLETQRVALDAANQNSADLQKKLDTASAAAAKSDGEVKSVTAAQVDSQSKLTADLDAANAKAARAQTELKAAAEASDTARKTVQSQQQEIDRLKLQLTALQDQASKQSSATTTQIK